LCKGKGSPQHGYILADDCNVNVFSLFESDEVLLETIAYDD
jgi:hypothetical protein